MADIYALVKNGFIVDGPKSLPVNYGNISNLPALSDGQLFILGWYPALLTAIPPFDTLTSKLMTEWVIGNDFVSQSHSIIEMTVQEKANVQFDLTQSFHAYTGSAVIEINTRSRDIVNSYMMDNQELFQQREREVREIVARQEDGQQIRQVYYPTVLSLSQDEGVSFGQYVQSTWDELQPYYTQSAYVETRRRKALKLMKSATTQSQVDDILANLGY